MSAFLLLVIIRFHIVLTAMLIGNNLEAKHSYFKALQPYQLSKPLYEKPFPVSSQSYCYRNCFEAPGCMGFIYWKSRSECNIFQCTVSLTENTNEGMSLDPLVFIRDLNKAYNTELSQLLAKPTFDHQRHEFIVKAKSVVECCSTCTKGPSNQQIENSKPLKLLPLNAGYFTDFCPTGTYLRIYDERGISQSYESSDGIAVVCRGNNQYAVLESVDKIGNMTSTPVLAAGCVPIYYEL